jgi:hypothetical protein
VIVLTVAVSTVLMSYIIIYVAEVGVGSTLGTM